MKAVRVVALMTVATCLLASATTPSTIIPERFRHGQFYQDVLAKESSLHGLGASLVPNTTANYFAQPVSHSDPSMGTFQQRYFVDDSHWDGEGPAILYISGEQTAYSSPNGFLAQWGQSVNALMFTLEHRWYGDSKVGPDYTNMTLLKTLTVSNALADMNFFMNYIDAKYNRTLTWVSCGGSYAGALSAWLKVTYPDRIKAAWSSSGVVNPRFDYSAYEGHIVSVLPRDCVKAIQAVYTAIYAVWDTTEGFQALLTQFGLPSNTTKVDFAENIADTYAGAVQYGQKEMMCNDYLLPANRTHPIEQFLVFYNYMNGNAPVYTLTSRRMGATPDMSMYLWNFQCCTQMAFWQIGYPLNDITSCIRPEMINTDYYMATCKNTYYPSVFPDLYSFNAMMGGATPNASHVIALQGSDDPYWTAGVQEQLSPTYPYVVAYCANCGHCGDLGTPQPTDPLNLQRQRRYIVQYMNSWLGLQHNVSLDIAAGYGMQEIQSSILSALNLTFWTDAMVYECTSNNCQATFPNITLAHECVALANKGQIAGVTSATNVVPGGDDGFKLTRLELVGIVVGGVVAVVVIGIIVSVVIRNRRSRDQDYRALN